MDKRIVLRVKDALVKDGYTCTYEETDERAKVPNKYIFGTSEVADVHCYKEDDKKVFIYEMFFVDSYRFNFYVIEDKDFEKTEDKGEVRVGRGMGRKDFDRPNCVTVYLVTD